MNEAELLTVEDDSELLVVAKGFFKKLNIAESDLVEGAMAQEENNDSNKPLELFNSLMKSAVSSIICYNERKPDFLRIVY